MPQPAGNFSNRRIGQGFTMSNNLNSRKPAAAQSRLDGAVASSRNGAAKNVSDCPANSSATTSLGSDLSIAAIVAGANLTQTTEPNRTRIAITADINTAGAPKLHIKAKTMAGGSEPQVPGAAGNRPRPKQDTSNLLII